MNIRIPFVLLCLFSGLETGAAEPSIEEAIRKDRDAIAVKVKDRETLPKGQLIITANVTEVQQFLIWDETVFKLEKIWGMDPTKMWIVNCDGNRLFAFDIGGKGFYVKSTKLPIKSIQELGNRDTRTVTVQLVDDSFETLHFN